MNSAFSWCPVCKKWVPEELMNTDVDEETGKVLRVCTPCIDGVETNYVLDEEHETVRCLYCDSVNTVELAPKWRHFKCNECGETFVI